MKQFAVFDIETGPASDEVLARVKPQFSAASNVKDPLKIAAQIEEKEAKWLENAALSAETCNVLAIGVIDDDSVSDILIGDEAEIITGFFTKLDGLFEESGFIAGWNIAGFDLPILWRRAKILGIRTPVRMHAIYRNRFQWSEKFVDLMQLWACGNREQCESLDTVAKAHGLAGKNGNGKDFAKLLKTDPDKAKSYLVNDLRQTAALYRRMCL